jgi:hypothetical protein
MRNVKFIFCGKDWGHRDTGVMKIKVLGTREIRDATLPATAVQVASRPKNHLLRSSVAGLLMAAMEFAIPKQGNCLTISALMTPTSEPTFAGVFLWKTYGTWRQSGWDWHFWPA